MTMIITGVNRGLGYATAKILAAKPSHTIVLAGRDLHRLQRAAQRIRSATGNENLVPIPLDLASLDSARAFSAQYKALNLPPLKTIICNAGVSKLTAREHSADGYEIAWMRFTWYHLLPVISRLFKFGRSSAQAGADLAYLATAPELEGVTATYFSGRKVAASSAESYDLGKAADLWNTSIALSRLQPDESPLLRQQAA